jgi:hypothetical protein
MHLCVLPTCIPACPTIRRYVYLIFYVVCSQSEEVLRTWNRESQEAFFKQRKAFWAEGSTGGSKKKIPKRDRGMIAERMRSLLADACRERCLWPGGGLAKMRDRLLRFDFCRSLLTPAELRSEEEHEAIVEAASQAMDEGVEGSDSESQSESESDSQSESESESESESKKELKHRRERQAALHKAELEAKRALRQSLRESPPDITRRVLSTHALTGSCRTSGCAAVQRSVVVLQCRSWGRGLANRWQYTGK